MESNREQAAGADQQPGSGESSSGALERWPSADQLTKAGLSWLVVILIVVVVWAVLHFSNGAGSADLRSLATLQVEAMNEWVAEESGGRRTLLGDIASGILAEAYVNTWFRDEHHLNFPLTPGGKEWIDDPSAVRAVRTSMWEEILDRTEDAYGDLERLRGQRRMGTPIWSDW